SGALMDSVKLALLLSGQMRKPEEVQLPYFWIWLDDLESSESIQFLDVIREFEGGGELAFSQLIEGFVKRVSAQTGRLQSPVLTGKDLMAKGVSPGPKMGDLLDQAYHYQLMHQINEKAALLRELLK
ncbi:MAG: hypothetical protein AAF202_09525, partial [Pseudomonadota bacterium]